MMLTKKQILEYAIAGIEVKIQYHESKIAKAIKYLENEYDPVMVDRLCDIVVDNEQKIAALMTEKFELECRLS